MTETRLAIRPPPAGDGQQCDDDLSAPREPGPLDAQYAAAEDLARMAGKSPQPLMQELEAELQRNPAMQESLSSISRNIVQQAKSALDDAAGEDDQLQRKVERADPAVPSSETTS